MTAYLGQIQQQASTTTGESEWHRFVARLYSDENIERGTWQRASRELPSFKHWQYRVFAGAGVSRQLGEAIAQLRRPDREYLESCARWGVLRAEQGVPIDEAAEVFRLYRLELNRRAAAIAPGLAQAPKLMRLSELAAEWLDAGLVAVLRAHPGRVAAPAGPDGENEAAKIIRSIIHGGPSSHIEPGALERHGINPSRRFYAVRARPTPQTAPSALISYLCAEGEGIAACVDGDVYGIVERLPRNPAPVPVGTSDGPVGLAWIGSAFAMASRSHETQLVFELTGQNSLSTLGLLPSVLSDNEVGDALTARYIEPFERMGASGRCILHTVQSYLETDCALAETAKLNYLHVNSVRYRLRRFEEVTGRSLRSTATLVEVWWALARQKVSGEAWSPYGETPVENEHLAEASAS